MNDEFLEKRLNDGTMLTFHKYQLLPGSARALNRPENSHEIVLELEDGLMSVVTNPKASWYLTENELRELYNKINNSLNYKNIRIALNQVNSEEDAKRMRKTGVDSMRWSHFSIDFYKNSQN